MRDKIKYAVDTIIENEIHGFKNTSMSFDHDGLSWSVQRSCVGGHFFVIADVPADGMPAEGIEAAGDEIEDDMPC